MNKYKIQYTWAAFRVWVFLSLSLSLLILSNNLAIVYIHAYTRFVFCFLFDDDWLVTVYETYDDRQWKENREKKVERLAALKERRKKTTAKCVKTRTAINFNKSINSSLKHFNGSYADNVAIQ